MADRCRLQALPPWPLTAGTEWRDTNAPSNNLDPMHSANAKSGVQQPFTGGGVF
jgi:hypothetical protein